VPDVYILDSTGVQPPPKERRAQAQMHKKLQQKERDRAHLADIRAELDTVRLLLERVSRRERVKRDLLQAARDVHMGRLVSSELAQEALDAASDAKAFGNNEALAQMASVGGLPSHLAELGLPGVNAAVARVMNAHAPVPPMDRSVAALPGGQLPPLPLPRPGALGPLTLPPGLPVPGGGMGRGGGRRGAAAAAPPILLDSPPHVTRTSSGRVVQRTKRRRGLDVDDDDNDYVPGGGRGRAPAAPPPGALAAPPPAPLGTRVGTRRAGARGGHRLVVETSVAMTPREAEATNSRLPPGFQYLPRQDVGGRGQG